MKSLVGRLANVALYIFSNVAETPTALPMQHARPSSRMHPIQSILHV
jgi:hypothetical protein